VLCFSNGEKSHDHDPASHPFHVIEQNSVPIYDIDWGADEELLLLEGAKAYGLGSWADIADHVGGYRSKDEVRDHYQKVYIDSTRFPLPERASPQDMELLRDLPREEFQKRKKRRIEARKEATKAAPPIVPKAKPTPSVPSCHEVQGYMPGRLEFEVEFANEAEEAVQHMQFDPGAGIDPVSGEMDPETELKMTVMDIYNSRLTARAERKKVIFEHDLLAYKKHSALDKKRTKEERDLLNKAKPFARLMHHDEFTELNKCLVEELQLRQAISQLQDWRNYGITELRLGELYEMEKAARIQKQTPMGILDRERFASQKKASAVPETMSGAAALMAPEMPLRVQTSTSAAGTPEAKGANGTATPVRPRRDKDSLSIAPVPGIAPFTSLSSAALPSSTGVERRSRGADRDAEVDVPFADAHLLTEAEQQLCRVMRIHPKPYMMIKESILKEAVRGDGKMKKKQVKEVWKGLDGPRGGRLWEAFVEWGWIGKA
jgi:transcriptional adapter 2-alpha